MNYGVRQGTRKVFTYGNFETKAEAVQARQEAQLKGRRGLYLVKLTRYNDSFMKIERI